MRLDPTVAYYFFLITIYILLPLVPAIIIFRLFPNTTVTVSGPLQNLTINATGAFAAYVVTILLGVFLFRNAETAINYTRKYPVEGLIVGLKATQAVDSYRFYSHSYSNSNDPSQSHDLHFVVLFDQPIDKPQTVEVDYYESGGAGSGVGQIPGKVETSIQLLPADTLAAQEFRVTNDAKGVRIDNIGVRSSFNSSFDLKTQMVAVNGGR